MNPAESDVTLNDLQTWVNSCLDNFLIFGRNCTVNNFQAHLVDELLFWVNHQLKEFIESSQERKSIKLLHVSSFLSPSSAIMSLQLTLHCYKLLGMCLPLKVLHPIVYLLISRALLLQQMPS